MSTLNDRRRLLRCARLGTIAGITIGVAFWVAILVIIWLGIHAAFGQQVWQNPVTDPTPYQQYQPPQPDPAFAPPAYSYHEPQHVLICKHGDARHRNELFCN